MFKIILKSFRFRIFDLVQNLTLILSYIFRFTFTVQTYSPFPHLRYWIKYFRIKQQTTWSGIDVKLYMIMIGLNFG